MYIKNTVQDKYLQYLIESRTPVTVYLKNGICLRGTIVGFTQTCIFLKQDITISVNKSVISSVQKLSLVI